MLQELRHLSGEKCIACNFVSSHLLTHLHALFQGTAQTGSKHTHKEELLVGTPCHQCKPQKVLQEGQCFLQYQRLMHVSISWTKLE